MARRISVQIVGDSASLERSFKRAGESSEKFGKKLGVSFKGIAKVGAAGAAAGGVALVTKQLFASVDAAKEAEAAAARLESAFRSAGVQQRDYATAQEAISRVSKQAALDDEDLSDALAKLTRTTGNVTKATKGMELAANIARARNISLAAATKIVEKAHQGQLRGLKGVGVAIDANTTKQQALEAATRKFAGSAEAYGKTAAGAQDKLSVAFENLQERIGSGLTPVLTKLTLKAVEWTETVEKNWPKITAQLKPLADSIQDAALGADALVKALERIGKVKIPGTDSNLFKIVKLLDKWSPGGLLRAQLDVVAKTVDRGNKTTKQPETKVPAIARAHGGPVSAGRSYMVGERGPELFVPRVSGSIEANGGGGVYIANVTLPSVTNPAQFLRELQRISASTAASRRGPSAGIAIGLT